MKKVYALGVILADLSDNPRSFMKDHRLWYIFGNFADAEKCVLENQSDIFEGYYNLALIEEISVINPLDQSEMWGVPPQWWYLADSSIDRYSPVISRIEPPKAAEHLACFWVG